MSIQYDLIQFIFLCPILSEVECFFPLLLLLVCFALVFIVIRIQLRASHMLGKCCATEAHSQLLSWLSFMLLLNFCFPSLNFCVSFKLKQYAYHILLIYYRIIKQYHPKLVLRNTFGGKKNNTFGKALKNMNPQNQSWNKP